MEVHPLPLVVSSANPAIPINKTTLCGTELHLLQHAASSFQFGLILGHERLGVIAKLGPDVEVFKLGDQVMITCVSVCGKCTSCRQQMYAMCDTGGWILLDTWRQG